MTNRYDTYDERGNKNHYVQNKGLSQMKLRDLMPGWCTQERKGVEEPFPDTRTLENSPYVVYQNEFRPKWNMSRQRQRRHKKQLPRIYHSTLTQRQRRTTMATAHWFSC